MLIAFLSLITSLPAQTYKVNEVIYSYWSESDWVYSSKYNYEYNENGKIIFSHYKDWTGSSWRDYMEYEYFYDDQKRISLINILQYSEEMWKEHMKIEYTYSFENNDYEAVTFIKSDTGWDNYIYTSYMVDEYGNISEYKTYLWSNSLWTNYAKTNYDYTGTGETDEYIIYIWESDTWKNYYRFDYIYDTGNRNYLNQKYMWNAGWQLSSKDDNSFDENKNMILSITQSYTDGNWTNQSKAEYSYIEFTGLIEPSSSLPAEIELYQNYPNPFNPETEISFSLKKDSSISLELFNTSGQLIKVLYNEKQPAGHHRIKIDASDLESGIYFYTLRSGNDFITKKMTLIK
jgi:hypothetical protein